MIAVDPAPYPRVASANLACGLSSASAVSKAVVSNIAASSDGGTTWAAAGQINFGAFSGSKYAGVNNVGSVDIVPGATAHVAYEMVHVDGDAAASITSECSLVVTVGSRKASASLF